jgi:hypothetical protein
MQSFNMDCRHNSDQKVPRLILTTTSIGVDYTSDDGSTRKNRKPIPVVTPDATAKKARPVQLGPADLFSLPSLNDSNDSLRNVFRRCDSVGSVHTTGTLNSFDGTIGSIFDCELALSEHFTSYDPIPYDDTITHDRVKQFLHGDFGCESCNITSPLQASHKEHVVNHIYTPPPRLPKKVRIGRHEGAARSSYHTTPFQLHGEGLDMRCCGCNDQEHNIVLPSSSSSFHKCNNCNLTNDEVGSTAVPITSHGSYDGNLYANHKYSNDDTYQDKTSEDENGILHAHDDIYGDDVIPSVTRSTLVTENHVIASMDWFYKQCADESSDTTRQLETDVASISTNSHHNKSHPRKSKPCAATNTKKEYINDDLKDTDVLGGRGEWINRHPGHKLLHEEKVVFQTRYLATRSNKEKAAIAQEFVEYMKGEYNSRFLDHCQATTLWYSMTDERVLEKVKQVLRENISSEQRHEKRRRYYKPK